MRKITLITAAMFLITSLAACSGEHGHDHTNGDTHSHDSEHSNNTAEHHETIK